VQAKVPEYELLHAELAEVARLAAVAEMASAMAHEINQPLAAIAAYSSALERILGTSPESVADARAIAHEIGEQALRAGTVVGRIRALIKHTEFEVQPVDCNQAIQDLVPLAEMLARFHRIRIELDLAAKPPMVRADALQLQLLLLSLVQNSIDAIESASPANRRITFSSRVVAADDVELSVADTGGGIPQSIKESLFRPFATTKRHGTGLGLLACQRIAHAHGGDLRVDDDPGIGARLTVRLPQL
jgi:two-component system sensor histidine kinase DctS